MSDTTQKTTRAVSVDISNGWERQYISDNNTDGRIWLMKFDGSWQSPHELTDDQANDFDGETLYVEFSAKLDLSFCCDKKDAIDATVEMNKIALTYQPTEQQLKDALDAGKPITLNPTNSMAVYHTTDEERAAIKAVVLEIIENNVSDAEHNIIEAKGGHSPY